MIAKIEKSHLDFRRNIINLQSENEKLKLEKQYIEKKTKDQVQGLEVIRIKIVHHRDLVF